MKIWYSIGESMDQIDVLLSRGVDTIYPDRKSLETVLRSGKKLRLYQGFDPTGAQLHIGHAVAIRKLRQFQELGHEVIFLIGDFTAMIGDPTGKLSARKMLTKDEVLKNAEQYKKQASRILKFDGPNPVTIKYNSDWLSKLSAMDFLQLSHHLTYKQVVERDMFQERMKQDQDVYMNEFLYPVLQAYDSVAMDVDLEIGGSDQMFNMLMGRKLIHNIKQKEKFVMTVPLLTDARGVKIGKTEGNVIGLTDPPNEFYGKIMSLGDDAIIPCFTLLTDVSSEDIDKMKQAMAQGENPMVFKKRLACTLTTWLNDESSGQKAQEEFEKTHQEHTFSEEAEPSAPADNLKDFLIAKGFSGTQAKNLVEQGAVDINGNTVKDKNTKVNIGDKIKVGKKGYFKIVDKI